ncbi:MAG TPA: ATPase domain-containing protein [Ktedonobacterales bacterium]|jgi:circadian clock protein KaiC|nr:ATPase domain-containing protein [Ktedonobacterales bacterium]
MDQNDAGRAEIAGVSSQAHVRHATGVPHLDEILGGGIPTNSLALIVGLPGSGKTTIASQIALNAARHGKTALILTALSESTNKLIQHLSSFSFFDASLIGGPVQFLSLQGFLSQGLQATSEAIIAEARRVKADVVLLDGFRGIRNIDVEPQPAREFLYTVGTTLGALGATTIITSEADPRDPTFFPESTTADVIIGLYYQLKGVRQFRGVEVIKARATTPLPGLHALTLSSDGASVYPQFEERVAADILGGDAQTQGAEAMRQPVRAAQTSLRREPFNLAALDEMLRGGIPAVTSTLVIGSLGTGKTLLSLYYALAGVQTGERVVYLGMRETRSQLLQAAAPFKIGPQLAKALQPGGNLTFLETPPIKLNADILADRLMHEIDRLGAQRLIIDSVAEIERAVIRGLDSSRLDDFLAALLAALRSRGVTALFIKETDKALTSSVDLPADALSILAENVISLQQLPYEGALHRIVSVLKLRFSDHDPNLREFRIAAPEGFEMLDTPSEISAALVTSSEDENMSRLRGRRTPERGESGSGGNGR